MKWLALILCLLAPLAHGQWPAWQAATFTPAELTDPAISGPMADPDNNGVNNLLCYALGVPAKTAWTPADRAKLPEPGFVQADGSGWRTTKPTTGTWYFAIRFTRSLMPDITTAPEITVDLKLWFGAESLIRTTADGVEPEIWRDRIQWGLRPRTFSRLRITMGPPAPEEGDPLRLIFNRSATP